MNYEFQFIYFEVKILMISLAAREIDISIGETPSFINNVLIDFN